MSKICIVCKKLLYDFETNKRVKQPFDHISWVHKYILKDSHELKQCFFGEHLINQFKLKITNKCNSYNDILEYSNTYNLFLKLSRLTKKSAYTRSVNETLVPFFVCVLNFFAQFLATSDGDSKTIRKLSLIFNEQITSELERIDSFIDYEELRTTMAGKPKIKRIK